MRSDTRALLKVFGWSFAAVAVAFGVVFVAILSGAGQEAAWVLGVPLLVGVLIGVRYASALMRPQPSKGKPAEPSAAPDRREIP
jgi:hypothetical protein